jgi:DNA-binding CsgD family transcriptional regulator
MKKPHASTSWRSRRSIVAHAPNDEQSGDLLLGLGEARRKAGELGESMEAFQRAAEVARVIGDPERLARSALGYEDAVLSTGLPRSSAGDPSQFLLEEALRVLPPGDKALMARVFAALGRALYFAGFGQRAAALNEEAVAVGRRSGDTGALAYALNARCVAVWAHKNHAARLATATELLHLAEEVDDRELALEGHRWRLYTLLEMGDTSSVDVEIDAYERIAAELRQPQYLSHVALWRAMRALMKGRFTEAEALTQEMLALGRRAQRREAELTFAAQMLALHLERGDLARLVELEPVLRENANRASAPPIRRAHLAHLLAVLDRPTEARAEFERLAGSNFADLPRDLVWLSTVTELVDVCAYLRDARRAKALYELLRPYERWNVGSNGVVCSGPVAHYLGLAAATLGRWDDAVEHFEAAAALARRMDAQPVLARTLEAHSVALLARRDRQTAAHARELLEHAQEIYDELGMAHDAARLRARLPNQRRRGGSPKPAHPAGLTEREIEVLRLIAAGKSNQEIADELVLSVRTIERHITNLYGKIDARGRADATAYAFTYGLV